MVDLNSNSEFETKIRLIQKKKKTNLIVKIISACLVFGLIIAYFVLPISKVYNSKVTGLINYTREDVLKIAGLDKSDSLYLISEDEIETKLKESPFIDEESVEVKITPFGLDVSLEEIAPVFVNGDDIYLKDGSILDKSLSNSKDPLVSDYYQLFANKELLINLYSRPLEDNFVLSRVTHLAKLVLALDNESREKILGISYDSKNYYYSFYYQTDSDTIFKLVFDSAKTVSDLLEIIKKEKVDQYISYLTDSSTKDKFVEFIENIDGKEVNVKSIKVVMQTIEDTIFYHVKYNNPPIDSSEGKENSNV